MATYPLVAIEPAEPTKFGRRIDTRVLWTAHCDLCDFSLLLPFVEPYNTTYQPSLASPLLSQCLVLFEEKIK
ncbi:hypothetical protein BLOT_015154 [Blomia tropicalis]|nr:hypothetical protein BLOT_015154 [Blomia tropicalis]